VVARCAIGICSLAFRPSLRLKAYAPTRSWLAKSLTIRSPSQRCLMSPQAAWADYAAREAAAPQLAGFAGGGGDVYIGTGALVVALLVVIVVLIVR